MLAPPSRPSILNSDKTTSPSIRPDGGQTRHRVDRTLMRLTPLRTLAIVLALALPAGLLIAQEEPAPAPTEEQAPPADPAPRGEEPAPTAEENAAAPRDPLEIYADLNLFGEIFDRIRAEYVDPPDEQELIRAAIQGMLTSLDPHSGYLPPADYDDMREDTSGEFGGLGIEVTMEEGIIKVISPIDDTPAARAGIMANDYIIELDGEAIQGLTLDEAVERMRGRVGTSIKVTVAREGVDEPLEFELTRDTIAMRAVRWTMEGDVAILRLARFSAQAYIGIENAVKDIYAERDGVAPTGIILDLRNNPGGLVDQAVYVADAFLKQGSVVLTRGRIAEESARYDAQPDPLDAQIADVPLIVLINGGSASASEIVAGALQDHKRATLVGTRSFGKGSVQSIISLGPDGAMRLTTARYYTPDNRSIQALGITPDIDIRQVVPAEL